jgi:serine/threonine-protein kinase
MSTSPAAVARQTVPPGTRLGRYEILTTIAQGGMATVYLGRALGAAGFQRLVAIKCLHPHIVADVEFVDMFMDEARLAARIRHPNVVPTLDLENGNDGLFLVMEYVEGDSLLGILRAAAKAGEPIPPMIAIRIVLDTLHGLQAAHELTGDRGEPLRIVHRDVSPHNILVGTDGISRITDFGIARAETRISHTREGQIKGKLSYMSPEQTSGEHVDRRSDIFSTGIVLWEALAARRLFKGDTDAEVLRNLLQQPVPKLTEIADVFPPALDGILHRALARNVEERYGTAAEFAEALEAAGATIGVASTRAVADYIRKLAGSKVAQIQEQVRALGSMPQPVPRPVPSPSPDNTTEHEAVTVALSDTDTAVRIARGSLVIPTNAPTAALVPADAREALPSTAMGALREPPRRNQNTVVILGAAAGLLSVLILVGIVFFILSLRTPDEPVAPKPVVKPSAQPLPTATDNSPSIDVSSLPTSQSTSTATNRPPVQFRPPTVHPTAKPSQTATATAPPAGSVPFNPESM